MGRDHQRDDYQRDDYQREDYQREDYQREDYVPRSQWTQGRQITNEHVLGSAPRYHQQEPQELHDQTVDLSRPLSIDRALREQCRIPAQLYFVAAILDSGEAVTFSGPSECKDKIPEFFDMEKWVKCVTGNGTSPPVQFLEDQDAFDYPRVETPRPYSRPIHVPMTAQAAFGMGMEYGARRPAERRRAQGFSPFEEDAYRNRKRARAGTSRRTAAGMDDMPVRMTQPTKMPVQIQDQQAIWNIYDQRFRSLQQTACKLVAKAWVKLVEPKKQSTHPYTGSDEKAPDWWPKPWGMSRDERVRHKEPDHLYKKERVHLLKHILRMVVLPNAKQHPDIQKLHLSVAKLEEATNEALSSFFTDKDTPNNGKKRPYLREIFLLARNEEKYLKDEIDGSTSVYVMSDDKIPDNYQSDAEDGSPNKDDEDDAVSVSIMSSHRSGAMHTMMQPPAGPPSLAATMSPTGAGSEHSSASNLAPGSTSSFLGDLPHRAHQPYPPPHLLHPEITGAEPHASYDGGGIAVASAQGSLSGAHGNLPLQELCPDTHDSRRPAIFSPAAEFSTTSNTPTVYQTWQNNTAAPSTSPLYTFTQQQQAQAQAQATQHSPFVSQTSVPITPAGTGYLSHAFDTLPRSSYDAAHDGLYRPASVGSSAVNATQGSYPLHMAQHDARTVPQHGLKGDLARGHLR